MRGGNGGMREKEGREKGERKRRRDEREQGKVR